MAFKEAETIPFMMFRFSVLILSIYTERMDICPFSKFSLEPCWTSLNVVEPLRIMNLKKREREREKMGIQPSSGDFRHLSCFAICGLNCWKLSCMCYCLPDLPELSEVRRKKRHPRGAAWALVWLVLEVVFTTAFELPWVTLALRLEVTTEKNSPNK